MNDVMENRVKIPPRWWKESNNKIFNLPYT